MASILTHPEQRRNRNQQKTDTTPRICTSFAKAGSQSQPLPTVANIQGTKIFASAPTFAQFAL